MSLKKSFCYSQYKCTKLNNLLLDNSKVIYSYHILTTQPIKYAETKLTIIPLLFLTQSQIFSITAS